MWVKGHDGVEENESALISSPFIYHKRRKSNTITRKQLSGTI